jgi:hypothetical protein
MRGKLSRCRGFETGTTPDATLAGEFQVGIFYRGQLLDILILKFFLIETVLWWMSALGEDHL